jgi:tRNA dimethylallyltransferase
MIKDILNHFKYNNFTGIIIYGATASGKSQLALNLANEVRNPMIINCDSMQVYKYLPIITAQPKDLTNHYLYSFIEPDDNSFSVAKWLSLVAELIDSNESTPIIVGGTGMYISSLINGLSKVPAIPEIIVKQLTEELEINGIESLIERLKVVDQLTAEKISDRQRIIRALSVYQYTGIPLSHWQKDNFKYIDSSKLMKIWVKPPRDILYSRINSRFIKIIEDGAIEEVKFVTENFSTYPKAIGVREIESYIRGNITIDEMINSCQQITRNYGKRQETWFKNQLFTDKIIE